MPSKKALSIEPSATLAMDAKAKQMLKDGIDVALLTAGEPDFDTPKNIKKAAVNALKLGYTKYTPASGIPELKKAVCEKLKRDNNLDYNPNDVIITCGGKHALYNAFQAICNPGDEVIVPVPYWVSYYEQIKLADAKAVLVKTDEKFKVKYDTIAGAITPKTRAIVYASPNNPTGTIVEKEELGKIAELAIKHNIYVISDEVYEYFCYDGRKNYSIASLSPEIKKLTITVNAVSKTYSMTGWRVGYAVGPSDVIKAMSDLQSHMTSNPTSIAQYAAVEALNGPQDSVKKMIRTFERRRNFLVRSLNRINGVKCLKPEGSFYAFPDVSGLFNEQIKGSSALSNLLLEKYKVGVVPGMAFGIDNNVRLSFAASKEMLEKGVDRIKQAGEDLLRA